MNISRLGSSGGPIIGAAGKAAKGERTAAQAAANLDKSSATSDTPAIDVSDVPAGTRPRIASFMHTVDARLDHVMDQGGLSHRQVEALQDAKQTFHAMMHRLNEAMNGSQDKEGVGPAAMEHVLGALSGSLNAILDGPAKTEPEKRIDRLA